MRDLLKLRVDDLSKPTLPTQPYSASKVDESSSASGDSDKSTQTCDIILRKLSHSGITITLVPPGVNPPEISRGRTPSTSGEK